MPCSDSLFIIGPNSLVFLTALAWLATTLSLKKHRVPTLFWVELAAVTFLLPQLRNWWIVGYLPRPRIAGQSLYARLALSLLPALLAIPSAFLWRRLAAYILSVAGILNAALLYWVIHHCVQFIA
jgi:hypothetical protein